MQTFRVLYLFGINVDPREVDVVRNMARKGPVVLLPTHKSHLGMCTGGMLRISLGEYIPKPGLVCVVVGCLGPSLGEYILGPSLHMCGNSASGSSVVLQGNILKPRLSVCKGSVESSCASL